MSLSDGLDIETTDELSNIEITDELSNIETTNKLSNIETINELSNIKTTNELFNIRIDNNFIILINNEYIKFNKIDKKLGATSLYSIDDNKKYFMKIPIYYNEYDIIKREIYILKILLKYNKHFPKLIYYNDFLIITEYIGDIIKKETIPIDILFQINDINNILKKENIIHSDIKLDEMLIKDNILYIVDFGWAKLNGNWHCDINISNTIKPCLNETSDIYCMINIILELLN